MEVVYSDHARKRMKQRGVTEIHVELVLKHPTYTKKTYEGRKEAIGTVDNKNFKVIYIEEEKYLKIITIL